MKIEVIPAKETQKSVLRQLIELYEHDFSEITGDDVDEHGFFGYTYLDHYWTEKTRHPFFIKADGRFAGFVLVNMYCKYTTSECAHSIAEFFVMRKYRRKNVGKTAAKQIFDLFAGGWEVRVLNVNKPALPFWQNVIAEYTGGNYTYHPDPITDSEGTWEGVGYTFEKEVISP